MTTDKAQQWLDEIEFASDKSTEFQQAFATPLKHDELDIQSHALGDTTFDKLVTFDTVSPLTTIADRTLQFEIIRPSPVLISSIYFDVNFTLYTGATKEEEVKFFGVADLIGQMFNCCTITIGQNNCNIDHTNTNHDTFHYVFKRLFTNRDYQNYIGRLEYNIWDSPGTFQLTPTSDIDPKNVNGIARNDVLKEKENKTNFSYCISGIYQPANLFFQKRKILPPYIPLRITLTKNNKEAYIKSQLPNINVVFNSVTCNFNTLGVRSGIYKAFKEQYMANITKFPPLEIPSNPFEDPSAIYDFLDVTSQKISISDSTTSQIIPIQRNSEIPKALIFCFQYGDKMDIANNQLYMPLDHLDSYSILYNSQPIKSCSVDLNKCNTVYKDYYLRLRNGLGTGITNDTNSIDYYDFAGGTGIIIENVNPANNLYIPTLPNVGTLEAKFTFNSSKKKNLLLNLFCIFDQKLIIDKEANARIIKTV